MRVPPWFLYIARKKESISVMVKVLFIDDDPQAHRTLDMVLPDPYVLISAYTARQGIEAAASESADVVLLDINLPDLDGIARAQGDCCTARCRLPW